MFVFQDGKCQFPGDVSFSTEGEEKPCVKATIVDVRERIDFPVSDDFIKSFLVIAKPDAFFQDTSRSKEQQRVGLTCLFQVMQAKAASPVLTMYSNPWGVFLIKPNILGYWCDLFVLIPADQRDRVIAQVKTIVDESKGFVEGGHLAKVVEVASKLCGSGEGVTPDFSSVINLIYILTAGGIWGRETPLEQAFEKIIDTLSKNREKNQVLIGLSAPAWGIIFFEVSLTDRVKIIEYFMSLSLRQQEQLTKAVANCRYLRDEVTSPRFFARLISGGKSKGDAFFGLLLVVLQHDTYDDILPDGMSVDEHINYLQKKYASYLQTTT